MTRILATDPDAMQKPGSPLWGPLHAPHHWGESLFGYWSGMSVGGVDWSPAGKVTWLVQGNELEMAIPWPALGLKSPPSRLDFMWADNCLQAVDWSDITLNGDAAPNDRFNYRAQSRRQR